MTYLRSAFAAIMNASAAFTVILLSSCGSFPMPSFLRNPADEAVVYALGPRDGFTSPLSNSLKPACQALVFEQDGIHLTQSHEQTVRSLAKEMMSEKKSRLIIAGYAPPNLPEDHARALSDRRALAVRQRLIELGVEAANLQTVGFGNDFSPSGPSSGVVVIYKQ